MRRSAKMLAMDVDRQTVEGSITNSQRAALPETQNSLCLRPQRPSVWFIVLRKVEYGLL